MSSWEVQREFQVRRYNEDETVHHEQIGAEQMKAQSQGEHARTEAYLVVDPVRRTAVLVQPWYMRAYPYTDFRKRIEIPGQGIWFVLIEPEMPNKWTHHSG